MPPGSVLGPLLNNIYKNDLFYLTKSTNVCHFADKSTFYACDKDFNFLTKWLEHDSYPAIGWFENNSMKVNQNKYQLLASEFT